MGYPSYVLEATISLELESGHCIGRGYAAARLPLSGSHDLWVPPMHNLLGLGRKRAYDNSKPDSNSKFLLKMLLETGAFQNFVTYFKVS
jgi:hypothetical protein